MDVSATDIITENESEPQRILEVFLRPLAVLRDALCEFEVSEISTTLTMAAVATIVIETSPSEKPKRTRKTHHKVRTGCITCKIR